MYGPHLTDLLILTITGLKHEPIIRLGEILGQGEPMIQSVVGQLNGVLIVCFSSPQRDLL